MKADMDFSASEGGKVKKIVIPAKAGMTAFLSSQGLANES
jgi:hypothetical protein